MMNEMSVLFNSFSRASRHSKIEIFVTHDVGSACTSCVERINMEEFSIFCSLPFKVTVRDGEHQFWVPTIAWTYF